MSFSDKDKEFMKLALAEAKLAFEDGNVPIGAVLVIDGNIVDKKHNTKADHKNSWFFHAELNIIKENSKMIRENYKKNRSKIELFTTLEPCLMCLGAIILHRISRVVYACPDPFAGAINLDPKSLTAWYERKWPEIESGLFEEESYKLMIDFMQGKDNWKEVLSEFKKIKK